LGVARIVPLVTERGVAQPVEQALRRLRRAVIEASKQCGRNRLLEIDEPHSWPRFIELTAEDPRRLLAHPHRTPQSAPHAPREESGIWVGWALPAMQARALAGNAHPTMDPSNGTRSVPATIAAIGPEGGFTEEEVALAVAAGWQLVDLGPRILRVETAAIALAAILTGSSCMFTSEWETEDR
jgi:16S rRNA (uracil1498-N3)-methyltransferase